MFTTTPYTKVLPARGRYNGYYMVQKPQQHITYGTSCNGTHLTLTRTAFFTYVETNVLVRTLLTRISE